MFRKLSTLFATVLVLSALLSTPFSVETNYCGQCNIASHCTTLCGGPGSCKLDSRNCGTCICD